MTAPGKPHALFLTPFVPGPTGGGSAMRAAMHVMALGERYRVTVLALPDRRPDDRRSFPAEIAGACHAARIVYRERRADAPPGNGALPLATLFRELRRAPAAILGRDAAEELRPVLGGRHFDLVFCFRIEMALALEDLRRHLDLSFAARVVDFDDVESERTFGEARLFRRAVGLEATLIQHLLARRLRRVEDHLLGDFDATFVCSGRDRARLSSRVPGAAVRVAPNAIRLPDMLPPPPAEAPLTLVFVGSMTYPANQDAAVHFCTRVLPLVRERAGTSITVLLVGRDPPQAVRALGRIPGVVVTGTVDDVGPYYGRSHIAIVPIRYGGGTRIKIVEAFAYGRPVVSTAIGAEGLEVEDGRTILIADTPLDFAGAILRLAREPALGQGLVQAGRRLAEEKYGLGAGKRAVLAGLPGGRA